MNWRLKLLLVLVSLFLGNSLFAARLTFPNYGFFVDADGVPLDGDYAVTFSLYTAATDGTALWTETQTVAFDNGLYNTTLGASDSNLLPDDLADNTALYLGIKIADDAEATPRVAYSSTPWAKLAEVADRATLADVATVAQSLNSSGATSLAGNGLRVSGSTIGLDTSSIQTWTGLQTYSSQLVSSKDPADTTSANASVLINPTTASANEKLFAAQDNGTDRFTIDKEGDVTIGGTLTVTGGIASLTGVGDVTSVTASTGLTGGGASGDLTLALDQSINASWTGIHLFQTDVNFQFSGSENLAVTSDLAGSVDMLSMVATPSATAGTTRGIVIQQADSANTNGLDVGLVIDNADADLALPKGIQIKGSSLGAVTTAIDASDAEIGTALDVGGNTISFSETDGGGDAITLQPPTTLSGNITLTLPTATGTLALTTSSITGTAAMATALAANGTNCSAGSYALGVDASGNAEGCTVATTGSVTSVAPGTGLTGGTITSTGTLSLNYSDTLASNSLATKQTEFSGDAQGAVLFEGSTADTFEGLLTLTEPTADRTWTLPDASGTVALTSSSITGNAATATALAANGSNCSAGSYALGVDASGNAEGCTVETTGTVTSVATGTGLTGGTITSTGTVSMSYSATLAGDPALTAGQSVFDSGDSQGGLLFEGATANGFEGLLTVTEPTADRTWTLPDTTGTVALTTSNVSTATALAANGSNCSAGSYALGVDASGVSEGCTADDDTADTDAKVANDITIASTSQSQTFTLGASNLFLIDASTTANTGTSGVIDLNVGAGNAAVEGIDIGLTQNNGATTGVDAVAQNILLTGNDGDGDMFGIKITGAATTNALAGTYEAGITIDDAEDTAGSMPDAILITSSGINTGVTNAINASAANITNALNAGVNNILFAETDLGGDAITLSPPATVAGGIALTLPASAGTIALTTSNVSTATALAADPANCGAGQWAGGVTAAGVAEGCTADDDTPDDDTEVPDNITIGSSAKNQSFTFGAANLFTIDATTTANTGTTGVIDLNVGAGNAAVEGIDIGLTQNDGATAGVDAIAQNIVLTANDADGDMFGIKITGAATANAAAGTYEAGIVIDNAENTSGSMPDAILITSSGAAGGVTDAIDASASNITNALNAGVNNILFAETDGNGDTITLSPPATVSGNIALTLPASAGTVALTTSNVSTATALAADPANCAAGQWAAGVTAAGVAEGCTADDDTPDSDSEVPNDITIASTVTNALGGSANPIDVTSTLLAFDNSDDYTAVDINLVNADHGGASNTVQGVNISGIVGDAQATETAIKVGSGWDYALDVNGSIRVRADARTIADSGDGSAATLTLAPTTSHVEITCNDTDGCNITMSETGINQGQEVAIINVSSNIVRFTETSGVSEIPGNFNARQYDVISMRYISDRWVEVGSIRTRVDARTIADNGGGTAAALTLAPTTTSVEITCSDADGCNITMSETGISQGQEVTIINVSSNTVNFADTSGVSEIAAAFAAGQYDVITMRYISDRWVEVSRSNN